MSNFFSNFRLSLSVPAIVLVAAAVLMLFFTLFIYRQTNPVISNALRRILLLLRSIVLVIMLLILFESVVQLFYTRTEAPILAVAIDHSASMRTQDRNGSRKDIVEKILSDPLWNRLKQNFDVSFFIFARNSQPCRSNFLDSLSFNGDVTDITRSLEDIKTSLTEKNLAGIVLISDGNYNSGGNPVRYAPEIGVPVYAIAVGSAQPVTDMAIINLDANAFGYTGEKTPVNVTIRNTGYSQSNAVLNLKSDSRTVASKMITIPPSPSETTVTLDYIPETSGKKKLAVELPARQDEQTVENNRRTFYMDIMKSRLKIDFFAGSVSAEISFIRRYLSASKRYDVTYHIEKKDGGFYEESALPVIDDKIDMFIFQDFPTWHSNPVLLKGILNAIAQRQVPLLLLSGPHIDGKNLAAFQNYLPLRVQPGGVVERQILPNVTNAGKNHAIMQLGDDVKDLWPQLPPVFLMEQPVQVWPNSEVLLTAQTAQGPRLPVDETPLLIVRANGTYKSAALLSYGNWRWDLMMQGINHSEQIYSRLINNLTRWLESTQSKDLVRVETVKNHYQFGEPVEIQIQVYDDKLAPLSTAHVQLTITKDSLRTEQLARPMGDGTYSFTFFPNQAGDYAAQVTAQQDERNIGTGQALFTVGEYSLELSDTQAQPSVLSSLAAASNGYSTTAAAFNEIEGRVHGKERHSNLVKEKVIWNNPTVLFLVVALLSAEWIIRKRKGMV
jgi:hypothetical protein